jgi:hypothetical protein
VKGIDDLGNLIESTSLSKNRKLYKNLHGLGHDLISFVHDPDGRFLEEFSVMGSVATAMRDPVFYRWHSFINDILLRYKMTLPEYESDELEYPKIQVNSVSMIVRHDNAKPNLLLTYWTRSKVDLGAGMDFGEEGNFYAMFKHLQHAPFSYRIRVNNSSPTVMRGTCRIFLAPKLNEKSRPLTMAQQRLLTIEMDKFSVICKNFY